MRLLGYSLEGSHYCSDCASELTIPTDEPIVNDDSWPVANLYCDNCSELIIDAADISQGRDRKIAAILSAIVNDYNSTERRPGRKEWKGVAVRQAMLAKGLLEELGISLLPPRPRWAERLEGK